MEWFRTFREKQQTQRQADIERQAEELITLTDLCGSLYIAYNGTALAQVDASWTTKEIIGQLTAFRQSFINSRMRENGLTKLAAVL